MVGVLIIVGIIGYGLVYSGLSQLPNPVVSPKQSTLEALWPGHGKQVASGPIPKAGPSTGASPGTPRGGRT
jgi:hypothetical protein